MLGRIVIGGKGERGLTRENLANMPLVTATVWLDGRWVKGHIRTTARKMRRLGVTRVVAPVDFAHWDCLTKTGLKPVDTTAFLQALAPQIALAALQSLGRVPQESGVAIRGVGTSAVMYQGARALCSRVRRVVVDVPQGGPALSHCLWQEYGLPQLASHMPTDVVLRYSGVPQSGELFLRHPGDGLEGLTVGTTEKWVPDDCKMLEMLALLWETGNLSLESVQVFNSALLDRRK